MLEAIEWAKNHMKHETKTRVTMIHAQTVSEAQLDKMAELDIHPSFFPAHIYLWGEKHYQIFLGPERANRMNPVGSAARRGLKYTLHNDSPVVMMGLFNGFNTFFKGIHAAVNRKTINGRLLDDGTQKISIYDALKGVTINSAWQAN
jgi:predicted amidohydrolase YtcJ